MSLEALKFLTYDHKGPYSHAVWPLPKGKKPGDWVTTAGKLVVCKNGVHATTLEHAIKWLEFRAYLIELDGEIIKSDYKLCATRGRLIRELPWKPEVFAKDCADHVARYLNDAAESAGYAAESAGYAAKSAAYAKSAKSAAWSAAESAAWSAAWSAAESAKSAAWSAAESAAKSAGYAAESVAYVAKSAGYAAWSAGYAAKSAGYAAESAAYAAESRWQSKRLAKHLGVTQ